MKSQRQYAIIFNPTAGKGSASAKRAQIVDFLNRSDISFRWLETEAPGHAVELSRELAADRSLSVIAAGGDGTCNEVVNGLVLGMQDKENPPVLGVLPIGRGNDFAFGMGLPDDLQAALEVLLSGRTAAMDVGEVRGGDYPNGRYFANGVGVGFDTLVGLEANRMNWIHGGLSYNLGAIITLIKYPKAPRILLSMGDRIERHQPALVSIMNGRRMGGSFMMAPKGEIDDGLFNISLTEQGRRGDLLAAMAAYGKGTQHSRKDTHGYQASDLIIRAEEGSLAVHADGETICEAGTEIELFCHRHLLQRLISGEL